MRREGTDAVWKASPFLRILPPFLAGITAPQVLDGQSPTGWVTVAVGLALLLLIERMAIWSHWRLLESPAVWTLMFGCGLSVAGLHKHARFPKTREPALDKPDAWVLEVVSPPEASATGFSLITRAWIRKAEGGWERTSGCLAYVRTESGKTALRTGDVLQLRKAPRSLTGSRNPGGFDPRAYYGRQGVTHSVSLGEDDYRKVGRCHRHPLREAILGLRNRILRVIRTHIRHPEATGLAEALLIGYRADLDGTLSALYADTGVVHIIAISGLHIGLLYAMLAWVFERIPVPRRLRMLQLLPPLAAIWLFTMLAGAGPSVVRSAVQFTILGVGRQLTGRRGSPLNTLASSAFLLLAFRPDWLQDLGFQLSYAAVAGILLFHRRICGLLPLENPVGRLLRDGIAMSLAAQVLTTPLILHHFGRFPTWFLFTNMVAVPLSTGILFTELLMCLTAPWPILSAPMGGVAEWGIRFMNGYVGRMDLMPASSLEGIHLPAAETVLLYFAITAAAAWRVGKQSRWRTGLVASMALMSILHSMEWSRRSRQRLMVVWHLPGESLLLLVDGHNGYAYARSRSPGTSASIRKALGAAAHTYHLREVPPTIALPDSSVTLAWRGYTLLVTGAWGPSPPRPGRADCVVMTGNGTRDLLPLLHAVRCDDWVADGSNRLWKIRKWQEASAGLPLRFHSTSLSGAFIKFFR